MAYTYRYIPISASPVIHESDMKSSYIDVFQQTLNEQFYNSSDWWTIEEENQVGTMIFTPTDVRISHLINAETGLKLGDDWKTLLFKEIDHFIALGKLYRFDDNIWLTTNTEYIKNLTGTCTVRRCNNTLRWLDEDTGAYYTEPCCIDYLVKEPRDYFTQGSPFTTPGGFLHIETQFNSRTTKITENQRFLFGSPSHWTCYKVIGTGLNDFRNAKTYDNSSAQILTIDMIANFVNYEMDDVINGIANVYKNVYTIALNSSSINGAIGSTNQLVTSVTYNGKTVERDIEWNTSSSPIATVDANGLVTFVATGSCVITANIANNSTSASCLATVSASPSVNTNIVISPDKNYILEGQTQTYSTYLYLDNIQQADTFSISCNRNSVPDSSFEFTQIDGNHFSIQNNLRDVSSYLTITCTSGSYVESFNCYLKGMW